MWRIAPRGNGFVEGFARFLELLFVEIHFAEFFKISRGRIINNIHFQFLYAGPPAKTLENSAEQPQIRDSFHKQICGRTDETAEQNDVEPIAFGTPTDEVN